MKNIYKQKHTKKRKSDGLTSCNKSTNKQKLFNRPMENSILTNASIYTTLQLAKIQDQEKEAIIPYKYIIKQNIKSNVKLPPNETIKEA